MFDTSGGHESHRQHSTGGVTDVPDPRRRSTGQRTPVGAAVLATLAVAFVVATTHPAVATAALTAAVGLPAATDRARSGSARVGRGGERA